jgi:hypothetical protein
MTNPETTLDHQIALAVSRLGAVTFRNNSGRAWMGAATRYSAAATVRLQPGDVVVRHARCVDFGVGDGGADRVGFTPFPVARLVLPVFTAIEEKTGSGRLQANQRLFLTGVARAGGLAVVARSVDDAVDPVRRAMAGDASVLGVVHGV